MRYIVSSWRKVWIENRWLVPGIGIKRWLILLGLGAVLAGMGMVEVIRAMFRLGWMSVSVYDFLTLQFWPERLRILVLLLLGALLISLAIIKISANLLAPFRQPGSRVIQSLYDHSRRGRGPHVVAIGGGTGMPNLLRGLRQHTSNVTAIVTVADDGGSSGRLRNEFGLLPPGDFRNNIAALSRDETLMTQLMQYRFGRGRGENGGGELQGHAFGNLLIAALTGITGSFDEALLAAERVLAMRGRVLPSTLENVVLEAEVAIAVEGEQLEAQRVVGESNIPKAGGQVRRVNLKPATVRAYPPAVQAILQADLILIGPGSLYTSILPNLLVSELGRALEHAKAPKVYVCNLATQPGETDNYSVADHVETIVEHVSDRCLDLVLANDNLSVSADTGGGHTVFVELTRPERVKMITRDLVDEERPWRHDPEKLAAAAMDLIAKAR